MPSSEYNQLLHRVAYLNRAFIPAKRKEQTFWGQDTLRAYRLLAHAEIEYYLEQAAESLVAELEKALANPRQGKKMERAWGEKILNKQKQVVSNNNGIKRADIVSLFDPLGVFASDLEKANPTLLDRMDELGKYRGHDAHKGVHHRATKTLNSRIIREHVNEIVGGLEALDKLIAEIRMKNFFD